MGIVVSIAMLLGLIILRPTPWSWCNTQQQQSDRFINITVASLSVFGVWNLLWYGLRHLGEFWGWAAVISGGAMLGAAMIITIERHRPLDRRLSFLRGVVIATLALSFTVYSVTIVQLNLNLPIFNFKA